MIAMEKTLVIMIGLQGSGKSTFYAKFLAEDFVRVNLDTLKTRYQEKLLVESCLAEGKSFAVDNTNPTRADRQRYIPDARAAGYRVIGYFMDAKVEECAIRNAQREGKARVPDVAITSTARRMEIPTMDEGFDEIHFVKNDGVTMTIVPWRKTVFL